MDTLSIIYNIVKEPNWGKFDYWIALIISSAGGLFSYFGFKYAKNARDISLKISEEMRTRAFKEFSF